jgi:hypothetical protein
MGTFAEVGSADGADAGRGRPFFAGADCVDAAGTKSEICKTAMKNSAVARAGLIKSPFVDVEIAAKECAESRLTDHCLVKPPT